MKQPPALNTYRARLAEVQAFDLDDGRFLLATEPPRYMPMAEFLEAFELVEEKRVVERRQSNGKAKPPKGKKERRAGTRRGASNPVKEEAQRLFESGEMDVNGIHKKFDLNYSTVYSWSKKWKAPKAPKAVKAGRKAAAAVAEAEPATQKRCRQCSKMTPANGSKWCIHCMQDP